MAKENDYYKYDPSMVAAVIFIVLFFISTMIHIYQMMRTKAWFLTCFIIGGCFEWVGYGGSAISVNETPDWTLTPYIIQTLLLLPGPSFFAATIYMILGRIISVTEGEALSPVRKTRLTRTFVNGDVISFLAQAEGGGMMAGKSSSQVKLGEKILIAGLIIQILFFGLFVFTSYIFHTRLNKNPTSKSLSPDIPWKKHIFSIYAGTALILVRSIFRLAEYIQGRNGYLQSNEYLVYIFDGTMMVIVTVLFNIVHPSELNAILNGGRAAIRFSRCMRLFLRGGQLWTKNDWLRNKRLKISQKRG